MKNKSIKTRIQKVCNSIIKWIEDRWNNLKNSKVGQAFKRLLERVKKLFKKTERENDFEDDDIWEDFEEEMEECKKEFDEEKEKLDETVKSVHSSIQNRHKEAGNTIRNALNNIFDENHSQGSDENKSKFDSINNALDDL